MVTVADHLSGAKLYMTSASNTTYERRVFKISEEQVVWPADLADKALFRFRDDLAAGVDQHLLVDV